MGIDQILLYASLAILYVIVFIYIFDSIKQHKSKSYYIKQEEKNESVLKARERALNATAALNAIILETLDLDEAIGKISNSLPQYLGYETGVLALIDNNKKVLKRVGLSSTSGGIAAVKVLEKPFSSIEIKLSDKENFCIKALEKKKPMYTRNLYDVVRPSISQENAEIIQNHMNTKTTLIFPIFSKEGKPLGTFLISMSKDYSEISEFEHQTIKNFIDSIRIALNNATLYTSLQNATVQLKEANEKLKELDTLKNEFVSVASHELRTPMTAIKSYLWMALEDRGGKLNEKQRYYIQRGYNSVDRLIRLVNDMFNISRIEAGRITINMQSVDLEKLAQEVIDEVQPRAKEVGVSVSIAKHEHLSPVLADSDKIKEVFFNLLGNSIKFTPKDGKIVVHFEEKDGIIETKITDTGSGIEPEDIGKLFQKFGLMPGSYATNQPAMGTGLGLYICRSIVELHQGKIWAESEGRGKGATFSFQLKKFSKADQAQYNQSTAAKKEEVGLIHSEI